VKGASKGEGRGNAFLSDIKEVDAILHVVRCFENDDILHVDGSVDPVRDIDIIDLELILKDVDTIENKLKRQSKKKLDKEAIATIPSLEKVRDGLLAGKTARSLDLTDADRAVIADCHLITLKPMLFVCNIDEASIKSGGNGHSKSVEAHAQKVGASATLICGKIEEELAQMPDEDRDAFMADYGMQEPGLNRLIRAGYSLLGLITYFTAGEKEVRAWQIQEGFRAPQAAGVIHTDFEKGFIRAEVASYDDFVKYKGEKGCREVGKLRAEGKAYVVVDGDVMHFLFAQ
jgi:GTP-binding protein YchF